jgi:hypothetical protein
MVAVGFLSQLKFVFLYFCPQKGGTWVIITCLKMSIHFRKTKQQQTRKSENEIENLIKY